MKILENFLLFISVCVIVCMCYFSLYNTYQTDDYGFAGSTNNLGFVAHAVEKYMIWGGRYFSYSLNTLNPAGNLHTAWLPKVFPAFFWGNLILGFFLNFRRYFNLNTREALKKSFIAFLFYTVILASLSEHYFWLTGAIVYQLPHIFGLYFLFILGVEKPKFYHQLLKYFLLIAIIGSNEIVALFLLLFLINQAYKKQDRDSAIQLFVGSLFFCISFFAPGNLVRMNPGEGGFLMGIMKKTGVAVANGIYVSLKIALIIPLFIAVFQTEIFKISEKFSLKDRWMYQIILMIVLAFTGVIMLASERSLETLLVFALFSTSVLVFHYFNKLKHNWIISLIIIFIPSIMLFPYKLIYFNINYNLYNVGKELYSTDLKAFENEIAERHKILRNSKDQNVLLKPIQNVPKILYFDELGTAKNRKYVNQQFEAFYHKKSVIRK